jgi:Ca-activated chloride channel family protein
MYEVELTPAAKQHPAPLGTVRIRAKAPDGDTASEQAYLMSAPPAQSLAAASSDLRFAFAVAEFADVLRGGTEGSLDDIRELARTAAGDDKDRAELISLIERARQLRAPAAQVAR